MANRVTPRPLIPTPSGWTTMGELHLVNLNAGWRAACLIEQVKRWRSEKVMVPLPSLSPDARPSTLTTDTPTTPQEMF